MRRTGLYNVVFPIVLLVVASTGCAVRRPLRSMDPKPVLIHLPGIAGDNVFERAYLRALRDGGLDAEPRLYDWTRRQFLISNLRAYDHNRARARELARQIADLRAAQPHRPILLTCDSGGAGPTVWALEALPPDVHVDGVVLVAPALSADYDLSAALSRVRGRMVAFTSPGDLLILDWGTRVFGTIDGKRVPAAGRGGFVKPPTADDDQYDKLVQMPYRAAWFGRYGHWGGHVGAMNPRFASGLLAPLLADLALGAAPDQPAEVVRLAAEQFEAGVPSATEDQR